MTKLAKFLFTYRSYTPVPFIIIGLIFQEVTSVSFITGLVILLIGETLRLWSICHIGSASRTTAKPSADELSMKGTYGVIRNPLYAGNILIYTGVGIISMAFFPYLQIISFVYFVFQYILIVRLEEKALSEKFSESYTEYKKKVNAFIPKSFSISEFTESFKNCRIDKCLRSERSTIIAIFLVVIVFSIILIIK